MSKCSLQVESLEGLNVSEDYLRGYLEAFGISSHNVEVQSRTCLTVTCDRCYDILDRLTSMNADHLRPDHRGRKLSFHLLADSAALDRRGQMMGNQPSHEVLVSGFTTATVSENDLIALFGLYGKVRVLEMKESHAVLEFSNFESAAAALSALDEGFFRGCFLSVEYSQELLGGASSRAPGPGGHGVSRDNSWGSKSSWDNCSDSDTGRQETILQMSNTTEAEEFLSRLSSPLTRPVDMKRNLQTSSPTIAQVAMINASNALPRLSAMGLVAQANPGDKEEVADSRSVITLDSTSASSIHSAVSRSNWMSDRAHTQEGSVGGAVWTQLPHGEANTPPVPVASSPRDNFFNSLQKQNGWADLGGNGIAHGNGSSEQQHSYSASDPLFESFLSFDPSMLGSPPAGHIRGVASADCEHSNLDYGPVGIDLATCTSGKAQGNDVQCSITGTSMSPAQYDKYLDIVNAYFAEASVVPDSSVVASSSPLNGRFVIRDNSAKSVAFSDLSDDMVGVPLNHDTPEFVPRSQKRSENGDAGSVVSGGGNGNVGFVRMGVAKSTDPEDMSDDASQHTKGEYSIHSGQFEADIRNVFVGNIGRLMSDGVQQLVEYFKALDIEVLKVDIKISFAFLEVRNTPMLQAQIDAIALGSGGVPPPFGKDERVLRIEFVQQSSAGKRNIRLRRENLQSPTTSLFIVGFDHRRTPSSLLTSVFAPFGPLEYVELKNNYAFVKFVELADAIEAQKHTHGMTIHDRSLSVEFSTRHSGTDKAGSNGSDSGQQPNGLGHTIMPTAPIGSNGRTSGGSPGRVPAPRDRGGDRVYAQRGRGAGFPRYEHGSSPMTRHQTPPTSNGRLGPDMGSGLRPMYQQYPAPSQYELAPYYPTFSDPYYAPPPPQQQEYPPAAYGNSNYYVGAPPSMSMPMVPDSWMQHQQQETALSRGGGGVDWRQHGGSAHPRVSAAGAPLQKQKAGYFNSGGSPGRQNNFRA